MNIYLDLETLPTTNETMRQRISETIGPPANYKKPESIKAWMDENYENEFKIAVQRTALDGTWGHIACIGWAVDDGPVIITQYQTEVETLEQWASHLASHIADRTGSGAQWWNRLTWVGHNIQDFDIRFLWQRSRVLGVKLGFPLPMERYPRNVYDTMKEWSGFGKYVKQRDLEIAFGLERDDKITGADVSTADPETIAHHCSEDVMLVREIYRRMVA